MGGVKVIPPTTHLFDSVLGMPYYEAWEADFVEQYLSEGESVVEVGAGYGTTTVKAARQVGESGSVTSYEASPTAHSVALDTLQRNRVEDRVTIHQQAVGTERSIRFDEGGGELIDADDLPPCDVLILDCEGAEIPILRNIDISPRLVIVETHSGLGAPHEETRQLLVELGYHVKEDVMGDPTGHLVAL